MNLSKQLGLGAIISFSIKGMQELKHLGTRMNEVRTNVTRMGKSVGEQVQKVNRAMSDMRAGIFKGTMMMGAGVGMLAPHLITGKIAADFEDAMGDIKSLLVTSLPDDQVDAAMKAIGGTIRDTSKNSRVPLMDLTTSYYKLQSAIGDVTQTQAALDPTQKMAIAGLGTMDDAVGTMTTMLNTYGKAWGDIYSPIEKTNKIANIAVGTVAAYNTTLPDLSEALQYSTGAAKTANMSLAELFTLTGAAQTAGLKGSIAGTALNEFLRQTTMLVSDTGEEVDAASLSMEEYFRMIESGATAKPKKSYLAGIKLMDENGQMLHSWEILRQIEERFGITSEKVKSIQDDVAKGLIDATAAFRAMGIPMEAAAELQELLGNRGSRLFQVLLGQSDAIEAQTKATEESNNLEMMYQARMETLIARLAVLKNRLRDVAITIGEAVIPAQKKAAEKDWLDSIQNFVGMVSDFIKAHPTLVKAILAITAAVAGITIALGAATIAWTILNTAFIVSPIGWIVLAVAAAIASMALQIYLVIKYWDKIKSAVRAVYNVIQNTPDGLLLFVSWPLLIAKHWDKVRRIVTRVYEAIRGGVEESKPYVTALQTILNVMWNDLQKQIDMWRDIGAAIVAAITSAWDQVKDNPIMSLLSKIYGIHVDAINAVISTDFVGDALNSLAGPSVPSNFVELPPTNYVEAPVTNQNMLKVDVHPTQGMSEKEVGRAVIREYENYLRIRGLAGPMGRF